MKIYMLGMRSALAWCLVASWCAAAKGDFLSNGLPPAAAPPAAAPPIMSPGVLAPMPIATPAATPLATPPLPEGVSQEATAHIMQNLQKLHQEATLAVNQQNTLISAAVMRKQSEAKNTIEKEIPIVAADDTKELAKEVAANEKSLNDALLRSTAETKEALKILKDKTATAVTMSTQRAVRDVEKEAISHAVEISKHSVQMQAEAQLLAKEAGGAAKFSQKAAENTALWVAELPVKDAAETVRLATKSEKESVKLRHEYEDVKRMSKLAGNLALNTLAMAKQAAAQAEKAKLEATQTAEQAAQNALLLETIRTETIKARNTAMLVVSRAGSAK